MKTRFSRVSMPRKIARVGAVLIALTAGIAAFPASASAYSAGQCHYGEGAGNGDGNNNVILMQIYRCPDGHDYVSGLIKNPSGGWARVWIDDSTDGGATWKGFRLYAEGYDAVTTGNTLYYDGYPHQTRVCGDADGGFTFCTSWY
ncbi:hypothetical protein [Kitasatospora sp. NPDC058218]|uniref:hypothetical protein n=1 Tax=Kitasatospora sp. NPDC058218 TaxID=3346385 RepID=UPI0036DBDD43